MIKVRKRIDDNWMDLYFEGIDTAINFVSFEYLMYKKIYVDTERFNSTDTKNSIITDFEDFEDNHCEPYSEELRLAYIDSWDQYIEWKIFVEGDNNMNIFNMIKIPTAGGCHMYYGNTDNGNWYYATDSWDYGYILSCNPNDYLYDSEGYWSDDFEDDIQPYVIRCIDGEEFHSWFDEIVTFAKDVEDCRD